MPGLNQTGPMGQGPKTGRGMGVCGAGMAVEGTGVSGYWGAGRGMRRGRGYARGFGAGMGRGWPGAAATTLETPQAGIAGLHARIEKMEQALEKIVRQLEQESDLN